MKELAKIQAVLKAPKQQFNSFGKYKYRSCEDILEAVKPLLAENNCTLIISDKLIYLGGRFYIEATATIINEKQEQISTTGLARESETKKGMDAAQITGSASSYARKYALNGLFAIDDTKDSDTTNTGQNRNWSAEIKAAKDIHELKEIWSKMSIPEQKKYAALFTDKKQSL